MNIAMKSDCDAGESTPFVGDGLLLLFGLPFESVVLVIGDKLDSWSRLFRNCRFAVHITGQTPAEGNCGLILYHSSSAATSSAFCADMKSARDILSENGSILVFAENPMSFRNLRKLKQGKLGPLLESLRHGTTPYEQELRQTGFSEVSCYYSFPGLEEAAELVDVDSKLLELPHYWHPVLHAAQKLGIFRKLADGIVCHAGSFRLETGGLVKRINDEVFRQSNRHIKQYLLKRIDIRARGTLVLFMQDVNGANCQVARIVSDTKIDEIVRKNHVFLEFLHKVSGLSEIFRKLLPLPLCRMEYSGSTVYVETMVEGLPAWKVNRKRLKEIIFQDSIGFLAQLNLATAQLTQLQDYDLDELFRDDLSRIMNSAVIEPSFQEKMTALVQSLSQNLIGRELNLAASHGDYGYGNILVDPVSGALKGVIDWDTAREKDFPGIDLFNLLVQKERVEKSCGPLQAFSSVINELASGSLKAKLSLFTQEYGDGDRADFIGFALYLSFLRYVTRALQYPRLFQDEKDEYRSILELLQDAMPL